MRLYYYKTHENRESSAGFAVPVLSLGAEFDSTVEFVVTVESVPIVGSVRTVDSVTKATTGPRLKLRSHPHICSHFF